MTVQTGQIRRIKKLAATVVELVERNKRNAEEVAEALQEIVDDPSRNPVSKPLSRKDYKRQVRTWEAHFQGFGPRIMKVLAPLYSPQLSLALRPAAAGLADKVRSAIFWANVPRIQVVHDDSPEVIGSRINPETVDESLKRFFEENPCLDWGTFETVRDVVGEVLWHRISERMRQTYLEDDFLLYNLAEVAECAAASIIAGAEHDFRPLIDLYSSGNLPYEFEKDGTLYVLCAKIE